MNFWRMMELLNNVVPYIPSEQLVMMQWTGQHKELPNGCGTSACAAGWAGVHKPFNDEGFTLRPRLEPNFGFYPVFVVNGYDMIQMHAVKMFFDICEADAMHIFSFTNNNDPVELACRIINVIEANSE